jgi:hypothetical protein
LIKERKKLNYFSFYRLFFLFIDQSTAVLPHRKSGKILSIERDRKISFVTPLHKSLWFRVSKFLKCKSLLLFIFWHAIILFFKKIIELDFVHTLTFT